MDTCFNALLLDEAGGLRDSPQGAEIDVRLPWYRSLPVSVVEVGSLKVDDRDVAPGDIRFEVNGKSFGLQELPALSGEFWFVLDSAVLRLSGTRVAPGTDHDVELQLNLYPPYVPHLKWVTKVRKTLRAR
ncbi:MAG: hypothetical protein RLZZ200_1021 [Pseudomonadota bacterium]|jgi:hypothetical protein